MSLFKGPALHHKLNIPAMQGTSTPPTAYSFPADLLYHAVASSDGNPLTLTYNVTSGEILCYSNNSLFTTQFVPGDVLLLRAVQYLNGPQLALITNIDGPSQMQVTPLNKLGPYPAVQANSPDLVGISIQSRRFTVHAYNKALPVTANAHYNGKLQSSIYYKETVYNNQDISDSVYIIKDGNGVVYWPEYGFNNIGDLNPGEGYQIKLTQEFVNVGFPKHAEDNRPLIDR